MLDEADKKLLGKWFGRLRPNQPLDVADREADRRWYVDLDAWRGDGRRPERLRGPAAIDNILQVIRLAAYQPDAASTHLFAGFRGTGKTTELGQLALALRAEGAPGFTVLRVNARDYHSLSDSISIEEMVVLLAAGIGEAALRTIGEPALAKLQKVGVWERIHSRLRQLLGDEAITFKLGVADLRPALFKGKSLRDQLRASLGPKADERLRELLHELVLEIAIAIRPRQLVILVDDLDKYTVPTLRAANVYQEMADLFFHNPSLLKLPSCHTIYTVPPYLAFLNQEIAGAFDGLLHILPAVKVRGRPPEREQHEAGIAALTKLMAQRIDLDRLFGRTRNASMRRLALASGGNLRDLVLMATVIQIAGGDRLPIGMRAVDEALDRHASIRTLLKDDLDILLEISKFGDLGLLEKSRLGAGRSHGNSHDFRRLQSPAC
ncbi:MAG: hypothetical protein AB1Z98_07180 [Nannocystaceae bacterium]